MITWPGESLLESCRNNCAILTPSWLLKEYCDLVAYPITEILNASYAEQRLPAIWKMADVTPLPKRKPVVDIRKVLRPISLTLCISKVAEEFVVDGFVNLRS